VSAENGAVALAGGKVAAPLVDGVVGDRDTALGHLLNISQNSTETDGRATHSG